MTADEKAALDTAITGGLAPLTELLGRMMSLVEQLTDRVELLEWEAKRRPPPRTH